MKTIFCMMLAATLLVMLSPDAKALLGHTAAEKERRVETQRQLTQEQQRNCSLIYSNECLHVIISILSAGVIVMLITGTAIGSETRRDHETNGE